jgi:membrane protease YdiL (CAAX protease family)
MGKASISSLSPGGEGSGVRASAVSASALVALSLTMASLPWLASMGEWALLTLPSLWLLGWTALLWRLGGPWELRLLRAERRTATMLAILGLAAALLLAFALLWPRGQGALDGDRALRGLALQALVPLAEELFFRGVLLADLRRRWGGFGAALLVTTIFAAMHAPMGQHAPMALLSLVLCGVSLWSGSVLWALGLHITWNSLAVIKLLPPGLDRLPNLALGLLMLVALGAWGYASRPPR